MNSSKKYYRLSAVFFAAFILFTILVKTVDVKPIGPNGSEVGFAALNSAVYKLCGAHQFFHTLTDLLGYTAFLVIGAFGMIGLVQLIRRRSLKKVDPKIVLLGIFYLIVLTFYFLFNKVVVNWAPYLEEGQLVPSYPSSHTLMFIAVIATAFMQDVFIKSNGGNPKKDKIICGALIGFTVIGRLLSGMHWFTDILASCLLAAALILLYWASVCRGEGH